MRVSTLLRIIIIAVATLVAPLYAILQSQDFNQYRGFIEEQARAVPKKTTLIPATSAPPRESTQQQPAPGEGFGKDLEDLVEGLRGPFN